MKEIRYRVEGRGAFPVDQLRYDRAIPWSSIDSSKIKATFDPVAWVEQKGEPIELVTYTDGGKLPSFRRWESFGWKIVAVQYEGAEFLRKCWLPEVYSQTFSTVKIYGGIYGND
jgi:hypothetical protein